MVQNEWPKKHNNEWQNKTNQTLAEAKNFLLDAIHCYIDEDNHSDES